MCPRPQKASYPNSKKKRKSKSSVVVVREAGEQGAAAFMFKTTRRPPRETTKYQPCSVVESDRTGYIPGAAVQSSVDILVRNLRHRACSSRPRDGPGWAGRSSPPPTFPREAASEHQRREVVVAPDPQVRGPSHGRHTVASLIPRKVPGGPSWRHLLERPRCPGLGSGPRQGWQALRREMTKAGCGLPKRRVSDVSLAAVIHDASVESTAAKQPRSKCRMPPACPREPIAGMQP